MTESIKSKIRNVPHWTKQDIMFCDIITLLKDPKIKFYSMHYLLNKDLETNLPNLFTATDGVGLSRDIITSDSTSIITTHEIMKKTGL
jgi:uncharacterized FAD-dependent dehydrogenase